MPLEGSGIFDKTWQQAMLGHCLRCPKLVRFLVGSRVTEEDFSIPIHRAILIAARAVLDVGSVADLGFVPKSVLMIQLRTMVREGIVLPEEVSGLCHCVAVIYSQELTPSYFESMMPNFLAEQRTLRSLQRGNIMDPDGLRDDLIDALASSRLNGGETILPGMLVDLGEAERPVPCGIASIDQRMHGGLGISRSGLVCAFTGMGKSTMAINMAWGAALQGFRSRVAQTELPAVEMNQRWYACAARYLYDYIQHEHPTLTRAEVTAEVARKLQTLPSTVISKYGLYDYSEKICTIQAIADDLHRDQDLHPEDPPKMLCVDWLEQIDMAPTRDRNKKISELPIREMRHKLEKISGEFNQLCQKEDVAGWMFTQSDFAAEDQAVVKMSNKSEGKGASRRFSWFLGLGATREDLMKNILTVTAGKARNGRLFSTQIRRALHEQRFEDMAAAEENEERAGLEAAQAANE